MSRLTQKRVLLGVTGGIAAFKAAELARLLRHEGADVRVILSEAATAFITPLTFQALTGNPVHTHLLDAQAESAMDHIHLARWADIVVIAPATAHTLAKLSHGLADDLLATLCLVATCPIVVAPAMNHSMWNHPATQANMTTLMARGVSVFGPEEGPLACGETGAGRLLEPATLLENLIDKLAPGPMEGLSVLITAGPTREPLDPVRYISNRSSGKMGYAIAAAAARLGARVCLISGPTALTAPAGISLHRVETAAEMYEAVMSRVADHAIYIGTAAVADYAPAQVAGEKIKKNAAELSIELTRTRDILAAVAQANPRPYTVGFAAETENVEAYARQKLSKKNLDMIAANRVGQAEGGFDDDRNALTVYWPDGEAQLPMASKATIAEQLMALILTRSNLRKSQPVRDNRGL